MTRNLSGQGLSGTKQKQHKKIQHTCYKKSDRREAMILYHNGQYKTNAMDEESLPHDSGRRYRPNKEKPPKPRLDRLRLRRLPHLMRFNQQWVPFQTRVKEATGLLRKLMR